MVYFLVYDELSPRKLSHRWQNNIKIDLKGTYDVGYTHLTEDRMQGVGVLGNTAIEIRAL